MTESNDFEVTEDKVENNAGTGVEQRRVVSVSRLGKGNRAGEFRFDDDSRTYTLGKYGSTGSSMFGGLNSFEQSDVAVLEFMAEYLRETRENVEVELFVGETDG